MGCCNSRPKEKKPKEDAKPAEKAEKPKAAAKPAADKAPTPVREEVRDRAIEPHEPVKTPVISRNERLRNILERRKHGYHYDDCTVEGGDVRPLFQEGLVYRIVKGGVWYIYNDTLDYEAHIEYRFGGGSQIVPGEHTTVEVGEDGWTTAHAVVYPLHTIKYVSGTIRGYKSGVRAVAVSAGYLSKMAAPSKEVAKAELNAVKRLVGEEWNEEIILARCIENGVPYVDVNFPPSHRMLTRPGEDAREMAEAGMQRPAHYLPDDMKAESDAICGPVVPQCIDPGYLGNSWVVSATGVMAEDDAHIRHMFACTKPEERAIGAYRVALSKHGWWRSVIVDNYLPTVKDTPCFARVADDPRELWVSLLEKAYAKVHGSYATITGGDALQALQDFTGSPTYRFDREWEAATMNSDRVSSFAAKLVKSAEAGNVIVLSTPSHTSTSYLGCKRDSDPDAFKNKYISIGLRCGYTYYVERVVAVDGVVLFKVHNPWNVTSTWTGPWSAGSAEWSRNSAASRACNPSDAAPGTFWMSWEDAINYFDGGGIVYRTLNSVDYRVKGKFEEVVPSVVLEVHARTRLTLTLVLSQQDKRGGSDDDAGLRFAPCMLSVAQFNGRRHVVEANSSWDPAAPSSEYNFMVARDCALVHTFEPSEEPYLVIPRIHRKGVRGDYNRPYVIGIISDAPLDGKADIRCTHLDAESRVFKNLISFDVAALPTVEAEHQVYVAGAIPTTAVGGMVVGTAPEKPVEPLANAAASAGSSEAALSHEQTDNDEEDQRAAVEERPQPVTVTDAAGTPMSAEHDADRTREAPGAEGHKSAAATPVSDDHAEAGDHIANLRVQDCHDDSQDEL